MLQLSLIPSVEEERQRRLTIFEKLAGEGISRIVDAATVSELKIYRGGSGIWYDKGMTGSLVSESPAVTVSVLHTGSSYSRNQLFPDGILYPYPFGGLSPTRDQNSVEATKTAARLRVPVFTVAYTKPNSSERSVSLSWVEGWDDKLSQFLITFGYDPPPQLIHEISVDTLPFSWQSPNRRQLRKSGALRPGETRFHFQVIRRYDGVCCMCEFKVQEMLVPVHIRPSSDGGTDDPRNALLLCPLHVAAFTQGLVAIEPETWVLCSMDQGPSLTDLGVTKDSLSSMEFKPHAEAVKWNWSKRNQRY